MEENFDKEGKSELSKMLVVLIAIGIAFVGWVVYMLAADIIKENKWKEQWEKESTTVIERIDKSTYHINLGDGSSCFTMEKIDDSLSLTGVNVYMMVVDRDSVTVAGKQKSGHHIYKFAYNDFFEGDTPYNSKIGFNMN